MATSGVSCHNYLLWINSKLRKSHANNPAINLETITKRNGKRVLRCQPIVNREHHHIIFFHHISPLSCIARMLETTHTHKSPTMDMNDNFLDFVVEILLSSCLLHGFCTGAHSHASSITFLNVNYVLSKS